jgi:membrane protein implicated in regulation of membrane protease activity
MTAKTKALIGATVLLITGLFFLMWAFQTVWIASFPDCQCPRLKYWFYFQVAAFFGFSVGGLLLLWRAFRKQSSLSKKL